MNIRENSIINMDNIIQLLNFLYMTIGTMALNNLKGEIDRIEIEIEIEQ